MACIGCRNANTAHVARKPSTGTVATTRSKDTRWLTAIQAFVVKRGAGLRGFARLAFVKDVVTVARAGTSVVNFWTPAVQASTPGWDAVRGLWLARTPRWVNCHVALRVCFDPVYVGSDRSVNAGQFCTPVPPRYDAHLHVLVRIARLDERTSRIALTRVFASCKRADHVVCDLAGHAVLVSVAL